MKLEKFEKAKKALDGIIIHTPIIHFSKIHDNLYIKAENLQSTGSFKMRGAYYKCLNLTDEQKKAGVIAASAGNHAQGVARACLKMHIKSTIVMPVNAPISKVEATRQFGSNVVLYGADFDEAYAQAKRLQERDSLTFIEPFNDEDIIAGQGTIAFEILEDLPQVDCIIVPIGGGGLISGIGCVIKQLKPNIKVIGVEVKNGNSMEQSLKADKCVTIDGFATIADGISVKKPGDITLRMVKEYVDEIVVVDEEEIAAAILVLLEKRKIVSEGAGACAVAAAMFNKVDIKNQVCLSVVSGGNIDVNLLAKIIELGLVKTGRKAFLQILMRDTPGALAICMSCIANCDANIISVNQDQIQSASRFQLSSIDVLIETINEEHINRVVNALKKIVINVKVLKNA